MNTLRTGMLLAALTAVFMGVGFLIGGAGGALVALLIAAGMNLFAYWNADRLVLSMNHAREVDAGSAPEFYRIVRELAAKAGLPMPRVYVTESPQPNAFATGRDPEHAAVCATTGLLNLMSQEEIAGVIAHELGHVRNRDTLTMAIAATVAGAVSMIANFAFFFGGSRDNNNPLGVVGVLFAAIVAPVAALMIQMAVSRTREYSADQASAEITGRPDWLIAALGKLDRASKTIPNPVAARNPALAHLFIVNPLAGVSIGSLFASHPATADRIAALRTMAVMPDGPRPVSVPNVGGAARERPRGPWG